MIRKTLALCMLLIYSNCFSQTLDQTIQYISTKLEPFNYHAINEPVVGVEVFMSTRSNGTEIEVKMPHTALVRLNEEVFRNVTIVQRLNFSDFYYSKVQEVHGLPADEHVSMAHCCVSLTINCWKPNCVLALYRYEDGTQDQEYRNHASIIVHNRHKETVKKALLHAVKIAGGREEPF